MIHTTRISIAVTLLVLAISTSASADANAIARAHSEAFAHACAAGNLDAVLALYEDDAIVVWPGQGEEAKGKAAIRKLAAALCTGKDPAPVLKLVEGRQLGKSYVATNGRWEQSTKAPDGTNTVVVIRTTEGAEGERRQVALRRRPCVDRPSTATSCSGRPEALTARPRRVRI